MRKLMLFVLVAIGCFILGRVTAPGAASQPVVENSPHADAIRLVMDKRSDQIRQVDRENWWHDVKTRKWTTKRPFHPGGIDSTHMFDVSYQIDDKQVATWLVDTQKHTIQDVKLQKDPEASATADGDQ